MLSTVTASIEWTTQQLERTPDNRFPELNQIAYGDGIFVATGEEGEIYRADDPHDFTLQRISDVRFHGVAFGEGLFVIAGFDLGENQAVVLKSDDGQNWERQLLDTPEALRGIVFGNGKFLAVGNGLIAVSEDAQTWRIDSVGFGFQTLHFLNGEFFGARAVPPPSVNPQFVFMWSTDGDHWEESEPYRPPIGQVTYGRERYFAVTQGSDCFLCPGPFFTSFDGRNWIPSNPPSPRNGVAAGFGNGVFAMSTIEPGDSTILTSGDLASWDEVKVGSFHHIRSIGFGEDRFVAVGPGIIMVSEVIEFQPLLSNIEIEGATVNFEFDGAEGTTWELQASGDLVHWIALDQFTKTTSGFEQFSTLTGRSGIRYMRLLER